MACCLGVCVEIVKQSGDGAGQPTLFAKGIVYAFVVA